MGTKLISVRFDLYIDVGTEAMVCETFMLGLYDDCSRRVNVSSWLSARCFKEYVGSMIAVDSFSIVLVKTAVVL